MLTLVKQEKSSGESEQPVNNNKIHINQENKDLEEPATTLSLIFQSSWFSTELFE